MTLGSLFAGIGGFELAATWAGIQPVWSNEIDNFACKVLRKNFTHEIIEKDIREIGASNLTTVDIISGGFPCQPFASGGERKGIQDNRYLWPEMLRVIQELKPKYVIGENVIGLLTMDNGRVLRNILDDLENEGYHNEIFVIPACASGAQHRRDRLWICSHSPSNRLERREKDRTSQFGTQALVKNKIQRITESDFVRKTNGIPNRVDRLKGLGNAIVPQVAYEIFKAITEIENR